jgi:hypothetical protein
MLATEVRALGHLGGQVVGEVVGMAEELHRAVASRTFASLGGIGEPVRVVHDTIADGAYAAVRAAAGAVGDAGGALLAPLAGGPPLSGTPAGGQVVAALDAVIGDRLDRQGSPLALPMALRSRSHDVGVDTASLREAFPGATGRVVVFVHGLAETDLSWMGRDDAGQPLSYASALQPTGWTGAALRYNTGRRIAANGASLADLLEELVAAWPVEVTDLALVGHSMGGLIIRAACLSGAEEGQGWPALVRSCVYLGSPHHGATLERGVNVLGWLLGHVPQARPVATVLRLRSAGIKDLRYGVLTAGDGDGQPGRGSNVALLASARHHLVAGHLGASERHPAALLLGDLLVHPGSALGLGRRRVVALDPCERTTLPATNHFALLKDRRVAEALAGWLA